MRRLVVTHEFDDLIVLDLQSLLETAANFLQDVLCLFGTATLVAWLAGRASPKTDTVKGLAQVDNYAHDLVVAVVFELLADCGEENAQPDVVVGFSLFEGVGPASSVLVLGVFPLGADALLEEMVVGLWREFRGRSDVVL